MNQDDWSVRFAIVINFATITDLSLYYFQESMLLIQQSFMTTDQMAVKQQLMLFVKTRLCYDHCF